jgi:hypothetical protein
VSVNTGNTKTDRRVLIHVNCDCGAYDMLVYGRRWLYGPRCKGCRRILGPMQWSIRKKP